MKTINIDKYVLEFANNAPNYCIIPGMPGAKNCQTWASEVLRKAKKKYLQNEDCPKCFK